MKSKLILACCVSGLLATTACGGLSSEARQIAGEYFNTELSQTEPVMELRADGSCVIRAIRPGVLTYSVDGTWDVENDSLVVNLDPSTLHSRGDSTLIGDIPERYAAKILGHTDFNLTLEQGGASYLYTRHNSK